MPVNFRRLQDRLRERLLDHIHAGELSGLQLARSTGFQQAHISNFLNRKRGLSLEAMDAILHATGISLTDLLTRSQDSCIFAGAPSPEHMRFVSVPIVTEELCIATQVPNQHACDTLKVASALVQRLRPCMNIPRPHWQRFLAIRVKVSDVAAMAPRLSQRTIAILDRHHNAPPERASSNPYMFFIRTREGFAIRYLEFASGKLFARPHASGHALQIVEAFDSNQAAASVIGRICALQVQL